MLSDIKLAAAPVSTKAWIPFPKIVMGIRISFRIYTFIVHSELSVCGYSGRDIVWTAFFHGSGCWNVPYLSNILVQRVSGSFCTCGRWFVGSLEFGVNHKLVHYKATFFTLATNTRWMKPFTAPSYACKWI